MNLRVGSGLPNIQKTHLEKYNISFPILEEQTKIANLLTSIDDEIERLKQMLAELKLQKQSLMQKLLTGQIRVRN